MCVCVCQLAGEGGGDTSLTATSLCKKRMLFPIETFVESDPLWLCCNSPCVNVFVKSSPSGILKIREVL